MFSFIHRSPIRRVVQRVITDVITDRAPAHRAREFATPSSSIDDAFVRCRMRANFAKRRRKKCVDTRVVDQRWRSAHRRASTPCDDDDDDVVMVMMMMMMMTEGSVGRSLGRSDTRSRSFPPSVFFVFHCFLNGALRGRTTNDGRRHERVVRGPRRDRAPIENDDERR